MKFIKRLISVIICAFFIISITIFTSAPVQAYTDEIDQYCYSGTSEKLGLNAYGIFQTFYPKYKYVTRVALLLQQTGSTTIQFGPDKDGHFREGTITGPSDPEGDWVIFTPPEPIEIVPGQQVVAFLYSTTNPLYWFYRDDSCYGEGTMWFTGGEPAEQKGYRDMGFISYGTDSIAGDDATPGDDSETTPADDTTTDDTSDDTTGGTTTGESAPGTVDTNKLIVSSFKVDKSLPPPSELKTTQFFVDSQPNVKLNWKEPDTKKIDGYNIYRQGPNEEKFTKTSSTKIGIPTYIDQSVKVGQKYSYVVRSYSKDKESLNSNQADISIIAKATEPSQNQPSPWYKKIPWLSWWMILIYLFFISGITVLIYWLVKRHKNKNRHHVAPPPILK